MLYEIHSTNFSVWECIIIIGVGGGVRAGGLSHCIPLHWIVLLCIAFV